mgnify:CR=1 FL=1
MQDDDGPLGDVNYSHAGIKHLHTSSTFPARLASHPGATLLFPSSMLNSKFPLTRNGPGRTACRQAPSHQQGCHDTDRRARSTNTIELAGLPSESSRARTPTTDYIGLTSSPILTPSACWLHQQGEETTRSMRRMRKNGCHIHREPHNDFSNRKQKCRSDVCEHRT